MFICDYYIATILLVIVKEQCVTFGLQHEDAFNVDQGRYAYAYAFEANLLEAIILVA